MTELTIIATIVCKQEKIEFVKSEMLKLNDKTRAAEGCINYDLHQGNNNRAYFVFHENRESETLLKKHLESLAYLRLRYGDWGMYRFI